jgi:hypothetical protein
MADGRSTAFSPSTIPGMSSPSSVRMSELSTGPRSSSSIGPSITSCLIPTSSGSPITRWKRRHHFMDTTYHAAPSSSGSSRAGRTNAALWAGVQVRHCGCPPLGSRLTACSKWESSEEESLSLTVAWNPPGGVGGALGNAVELELGGRASLGVALGARRSSDTFVSPLASAVDCDDDGSGIASDEPISVGDGEGNVIRRVDREDRCDGDPRGAAAYYRSAYSPPTEW